MKILLLGAKGMLGQDLVKAKPMGIDLVAYGREIDITQPEDVKRRITSDKPDLVVNAAAFNQVDAAQGEKREEAYAVNHSGPKNLAVECSMKNIPLIHFSTDYVFADNGKIERSESDPTNPISEYGKSKLLGEQAISQNKQYYILRVSTLYGTGRPNHATKVIEAIKNNKPISIVDDLTCTPSYTGDLARWIYQLIEKKPAFGIYHLAHKGVLTRFDFAVNLFEKLKSSKPSPIKRVSIKDLGLQAPRPLRVALNTNKWEKNIGPLSSCEKGLDEFLKECGIL